MTDEFVGHVKQPTADTGVERDLAHEDEQGNHGEAIGAEHIEDVFDQHIQGRIKGHHIAKTNTTDHGHEKSHRHA